MLIRLFRTSHPLSYILLPTIGILLRIPLLFHSFDESQLVALSSLESYIVSHPWINVLLAGVLAGILGIFVNYISDQFGFLDRVSGLTGLSFVLLSAWTPESASFSYTYLSCGILLIAIYQLYDLGQSGGYAQVFNASLLISVASLITKEAIVLQLLVLFAIIYFQTIHWRHFTIWLLGLILPFLYYAVWNSFYPSDMDLLDLLLPNMDLLQSLEIIDTVKWVFNFMLIALIIIISYKSFSKGVTNNTARIRKSFLLSIWILVLCMLAIFQSAFTVNSPFLFLAVPLSLILSNYLFYSKKTWLAEQYLLVIIAIEISSYWI